MLRHYSQQVHSFIRTLGISHVGNRSQQGYRSLGTANKDSRSSGLMLLPILHPRCNLQAQSALGSVVQSRADAVCSEGLQSIPLHLTVQDLVIFFFPLAFATNISEPRWKLDQA